MKEPGTCFIQLKGKVKPSQIYMEERNIEMFILIGKID